MPVFLALIYFHLPQNPKVKTLRGKKHHQTCHASACEHMEHLVDEKGGFPSGVAGGAQDFDQVQLIHHEIAEKLKEEGEESPPPPRS